METTVPIAATAEPETPNLKLFWEYRAISDAITTQFAATLLRQSGVTA